TMLSITCAAEFVPSGVNCWYSQNVDTGRNAVLIKEVDGLNSFAGLTHSLDLPVSNSYDTTTRYLLSNVRPLGQLTVGTLKVLSLPIPKVKSLPAKGVTRSFVPPNWAKYSPALLPDAVTSRPA